MTSPVDVLAQAIRTADGSHTLGAGALAEVAANALVDDRIVDHAYGLVRGMVGFDHVDDRTAKALVRVALGSVAGEL